jgi:hypothetical protein
MKPETDLSRRDFVQGLGVAAGASALVAGSGSVWAEEPGKAGANPPAVAPAPLLPTRKLGKNGPNVSILAMGGDMPQTSAMSLLNKAWASGMRYYDTAQKYGQAQEESVYKEWFARYPDRRKQIFLVSKDYPKKGPEQLLEMIDKRLETLGTDYLDLFFIHQLCPEVYGAESVDWPKSDRFRKVADKLRDSGKVKMVGFSCHGGPEYIQAAADGGFLDALMVFYTPFYQKGDVFDRALTACHEKGIGLIAMKTLRHAGNVPKRIPEFEKLGLSTHQAIFHAAWSDPRITAICNSIKNFDQMRSSISAAHGYKEPLHISLREKLEQIVMDSRRTMCPGCPSCDANATEFAFRDISRYVTYHEQDNNPQARELFQALSASARDASTIDLVALKDNCAFGINYPEVIARAERYFS